MTTTVHKNLTGADLHEPKGADTAPANEVYVSNGAGSGTWTLASSIITNTAFTTGDLKPTHKTAADSTWILWSDGTIGDSSSGATIRANADTAALFALYWNGYTNTQCPVSTGRGASAVADYAAHKTIALPVGSGRVFGLAGAGSGLTARTVGDSVGVETVTLSSSQIPSITSSTTLTIPGGKSIATYLSAATSSVNPTGSINGVYDLGGISNISLLTSLTGTATSNNTGGTSHTNMQPTSWLNMMIKL